MEKEISVSITPQTILVTLLMLVGGYLLWMLRDLLLLIITAIVIASSIEPGVAFFVRYKIPRFFSVLLMYVLVFGSLFSLIYFFFPPLIADASQFFSTIPQYLNTINVPDSLTGISFLGDQSQAQSLIQTLSTFQSVFTSSSEGVFRLIATFFGGIFSLLLVIVLSFYFALQETGVDDFLRLVLPLSYEEYAVGLWRRAQKKIGLWMQGQILLSVIVGVLVYLGLLIIGIPHAFLLAVVTAMAEIIPVFGSLLSGVVAAGVASSEGGLALALITIGLYVVVNQFESNLIYPLIVKKVVGLPPLLVILALIAGGTLAGFLGILLSVPIAAVALEFLSDLEKRKRSRARV